MSELEIPERAYEAGEHAPGELIPGSYRCGYSLYVDERDGQGWQLYERIDLRTWGT